MADPILVGGIRVLAILQGRSGLPEDRYITTWAFASDVAESEAGLDAAMDKVDSFYTTPAVVSGSTVAALLPSDTLAATGHELRAYSLAQAPPRIPRIREWDLGTLGSADALPSEVAACVSYYSEQNVPRNRGRIYVGPLTQAVCLNQADQPQRLNNTAVLTLADRAEALATLAPGSPEWCVIGLGPGVSGYQLKVITAGWVDNAFDIQRRRGEVASQRVPWPAP